MKIFNFLSAFALVVVLMACGGDKAAENNSENNANAEAIAADDSMSVGVDNEVVSAIMARRSIRQWQPQGVGRDTLEAIMKCGINAANGQNKQSWEVRVVNNPETMAKINQLLDEATAQDAKQKPSGCFRGAPVMVFIARDTTYVCSAYDCGLLAGNMMLAATSVGVGSICLGSPAFVINSSPASKAVLDLLGFSENYELSLAVGLGYAAESPAQKPRMWEKVKFLE